MEAAPPETDPSPASARVGRGADVLAGFLVFLIALPLCLGISLASGYPPLAGVFTAVVGALVATFLSDSALTIKGPAAGLIVVAVGCVADFGGDGMVGGFDDADRAAYRAALAVGVAAAALQVTLAACRAGGLVDFFPSAVVRGMLASIGVIIVVKQLPIVLGVSAGGEPFEMLLETPHYVGDANPAIAGIGVLSLAVLFLWPLLRRTLPVLASLPAPLAVLLLAMGLSAALDLTHDNTYTVSNRQYELGEQYLVAMPERAFGMFDALTTPDFAALAEPKAWKWVVMFFAVGSLESLLSASAIDLLDPQNRKTDMNRDLAAVGVGNVVAALVGGLPMISEIVRSKANVDNGAQTRWANFWHGVFLLACVALIPTVLHRIPLAALAAMLVYTGYRLAHPAELVRAYRSGWDQLAVFVATLITAFATDLLIGVAAGVTLLLVLHVVRGVSVGELFRPRVEHPANSDADSHLAVTGAAVFSNWLPLRRQIERAASQNGSQFVVDFSQSPLVDPSVRERLVDLRSAYAREGRTLRFEGLGD